ncbi:hypothetical protein DFH06DRAFT_1141243 [Mycena polygramma]|nr:hypothetical protein DFH06DRAFT_1141243 [Mycena polygramma]
MDENPPAKRPRSDSDSPIVRSPVWYSDGSVVLQAETTQFRVHASILSQTGSGSIVFKDMFEVAQAPNNADFQVDGCPLVQLYGDKAQDVEIILQALYDRETKTFSQVAAMWRLGNKYEFSELRDDSLQRLEYLFPSSLSLFQERYYDKQVQKTRQAPLKSPIHHYPGLVFDAINLARETNLLSILPAAFYRACSASVSHENIVQSIMN